MKISDFKITYDDRCPQCFMRKEICLCSSITKFNNKFRLSIVMHHREAYKTTATARLAHLALENSRILLRGHKELPLDIKSEFPNPESCLFLNLSDQSEDLSPQLLKSHNYTELVVPDGNWRQARKMGRREPVFKQMKWVKIPVGLKSSYLLRKEPTPEGLATIEAIARALGQIEGPEVQVHLEALFNMMVERTLNTRPKNRQEQNLKLR